MDNTENTCCPGNACSPGAIYANDETCWIELYMHDTWYALGDGKRVAISEELRELRVKWLSTEEGITWRKEAWPGAKIVQKIITDGIRDKNT